MSVEAVTAYVCDFLPEKQIGKPSLPDIVPRPVSRRSHGLESLPAEVVDHIADYLSARSALALHFSSKLLSEKVPLDDRFWKSRLCDGSLVLHLWDVNEQELRQRTAGAIEWDWKGLIETLSIEFSEDCKPGLIPPGLWNRCRILNYIEEILKSSNSFPSEQSLSAHSIRASKSKGTSTKSNIQRLLVVVVAVMIWDLRDSIFKKGLQS